MNLYIYQYLNIDVEFLSVNRDTKQEFTYQEIPSFDTNKGLVTKLEINNRYKSVRYAIEDKYYFEHELRLV